MDNRLERYGATGQRSVAVRHRGNDDAFSTVQHNILAVLDKVSTKDFEVSQITLPSPGQNIQLPHRQGEPFGQVAYIRVL